MINPTPGYLAPYVLTGTLTLVAAAIFGLHKALKLAGWPAQQRRRASIGGAALLLAWLFAALLTAWFGVYRLNVSPVPAIPFAILIPIVAGVALFRWSASFRRVVHTLPQPWIVSLELFRAEGVIFLILYAGGHLPGVFAWPAGIGDMLTGLLAPIVAIRYARNSPHAAGWLRAWNLFGILDLIVAVTTAFLSSPSQFQMFALAAPNLLISAFPLVMIPVFLVPLAILLHLASLQKLAPADDRHSAHLPVPQAGSIQ
jgi:hypothetical protein